MNDKAKLILSQSPSPFKYIVVILILAVIAILLHSVLAGILMGIAIGAYFGNYRGRFTVIEAWRVQMDADHQERMTELDTRYEELLRSQSSCS